MFVGGRDRTGADEDEIILSQSIGRVTSTDFVAWEEQATSPAISTANPSPDQQHRHWDVLPFGITQGNYALFFDDKNGPGGTNRILVEPTGTAGWSAAIASTVGSKACTP
jgi:hypothetical protein